MFIVHCDSPGCQSKKPAHKGNKFHVLPEDWWLGQTTFGGPELHVCDAGCQPGAEATLPEDLRKRVSWKHIQRAKLLVGAEFCKWCKSLGRPCPAHEKAAKKWMCLDCGYRVTLVEQPKACPNCGKANFAQIAEVG